MRALVVAALLVVGVARAEAQPWWNDPARGCGSKAAWERSKRIADLPGCDGELPKGAPPGEVAMHDAKALLRGAEKLLDEKGTDGVAARIDRAAELIGKAPSDPRLNFARRFYDQAFALLRDRLKK